MKTFLFYLFFMALFLCTFKLIENKVLLFTKIVRCIKYKYNIHVIISIYIVLIGIILAFLTTKFYLSEKVFTVLFCFFTSILITIISNNKE